MSFRIWAPIAAASLIALMGAVIVGKTKEEAGLRKEITAQTLCLAAAGGPDADASARACPAPVAAQHRLARMSARCDAGLLQGDLFAVEAACSTEVKTLLAQRQAETGRADSLDAALKSSRADTAAAITRAEARARSQTQRTSNAQAAVSAAPRDPDGLVRCDAQCLRQRTSADR